MNYTILKDGKNVEKLNIKSLVKNENLREFKEGLTFGEFFLKETGVLKDLNSLFDSILTYYDKRNITLKIISEPHGEKEIKISNNTFKVGRKQDNDLSLSHSGISGEHFVIFWGEVGWEIVDLESANGTFLNGKKLPSNQRTLLRNGDVIVIPGYKFKIKLESEKKVELDIDFDVLGEVKNINTGDGISYFIASKLNQDVKLFLKIPVSLGKKIIRLLTGFNYREEDYFLPLGELERGLLDYFLYNVLLMVNRSLSEFNGDSLYFIEESGELDKRDGILILPINVKFSPCCGDVFYLYYRDGDLEKLFKKNKITSDKLQVLAEVNTSISEKISFTISFSLLSIDMSFEDLSILEVGDIILDTFEIEKNVDLLKEFEGKNIIAHFYPSRLSGKFYLKEVGKDSIVLNFKKFEFMEKDMAQGMKEKKSENDDNVIEELSNVPFTLQIEVGRVEIPLMELLELKEGSVIKLERDLDDIVNLNLNGKIIGKGSLVNVDGKLGVKILELKK